MNFPPSDTPRLPARMVPPSELHLAVQSWENLLFLSGDVPPELLRPLVPQGLEIDVYAGTAWISLVLLTVQDAAPAVGIPLPWVSYFHQVNVRTYVRRDGVPGIWLLSTHVDSQLMVYLARRFFHLPYSLTHCHATYSGGLYRYELLDSVERMLFCSWLAGEPMGVPETGSLDSFLLDRYTIYAVEGERLFRSRIHHETWNMRRAWVKRLESSLLKTAGFSGEIDLPHSRFVRGMPRVRIWPMEQVESIRGG